MRVWRVAHSTIMDVMDRPIGPYRGLSDYAPELRSQMNDMYYEHSATTSARHRTPFSDPHLLYIDPDEVCAFDSWAALNRWFAGFADVLASAGFVVFEYEVPSECARVGEHGQALMVWGEGREIRRMPMDLRPVQLAFF